LKATALQFVKKQTCHDKENKPLLRIWSITQTYYILNQNIGLSMWQTHINKENFLTELYYRQEEMIEK
jgi:hypothetical protein